MRLLHKGGVLLSVLLTVACSTTTERLEGGESVSILSPERRSIQYEALSFEEAVTVIDGQLSRCFPGVYSQVRDQGATFALAKPVSKLIHLNVEDRDTAAFRFEPQLTNRFINPFGADYYLRALLLRDKAGGTRVEMLNSAVMTDFGDTVLSWLEGETACSRKAI